MKQQLSQKILVLLLICLIPFLAKAADDQPKGSIRGKVVTEDNNPAENVSVILKGTKYGTITDDDGEFQFRVPAGNYTLIISHTGYKTQEAEITVNDGRSLDIPVFTIHQSSNTLSGVQITGSKPNKFARKKSDDVAKMPLKDLENPQSYTSIGKEILQEQAVFSADDAIKNAPGITSLWTSTGRAGDGGSYFTLRGFPVQTLLRDGLSGNVSTTIDAANLEKLEVIKGPSGTLYGSSLVSFGGLINRVTKKPFDGTAGEISYSGGSYNFNRVSLDYNTPLDTAKKALFRINSAYNNTGSFQDNGSAKSFVFDPSFSYKVNDRLTLSFDAEISHAVASTPPIFYFGSTVADLGVTSADKLSIDYRKSYQNNDLFETSDNANFFARADYKISDSWKSQTAISTTSSSSSGYQPFFYLLAGNNSIKRAVWNVGGNANTLQIQQNFIGDFKIGGLRNRIIAGLDFLNQSENITYSNPSGGSDLFDIVNTRGAIPTYNNFNKAKVDSLFTNTSLANFYSHNNTYTTSAYVSDVLNVTDNLLAMASLRVDNYDARPITDPNTNTTSQGINQTTLSPKFGLVYQLIKNQVSLFGNYMNGFVNPGYATFYDASAAAGLTTRLAKTEQANQWEGGVKVDLFGGKLSSTISYYDISVTNILVADPAHANASIQNGTQYSKGIEAEVIANPLEGFNLIAGYSHNKSDNQGSRPATAGPVNSANAWLSYTLTHGDAKGLGVGFGGNYASNNMINAPFFLPSYTILNTGVFYNKEKWRFALNVNNLANKEYWIGYTTVDPQMLRQIIGSVSFRF
ncbi:MAG TPA: TonB-dependent receptor [Mucilaginibacter sp.]